jgi:hypothetical protein
MTESPNTGQTHNLFFLIDGFVSSLEDQGHEFEHIVGALQEYVSIAGDLPE